MASDIYFFFFKQKTAYEMRISDWSSDVCSSDLAQGVGYHQQGGADVGGDGAPEGRKAGEGEDHEDRLDAKRENDVLTNDAQGSLGMTDEPGQFREIVGHQRDVGRLDACIAAGRAHDDAEPRPRHGRRLVSSEESRVWPECVSRCRSRWSPYPTKKQTTK